MYEYIMYADRTYYRPLRKNPRVILTGMSTPHVFFLEQSHPKIITVCGMQYAGTHLHAYGTYSITSAYPDNKETSIEIAHSG